MPTDIPNIVPWGLHPLQEWVKDELVRRSGELNFNADPDKYAGPRTAWARFFSNGMAHADDDGGFVMGGVHGFNDSYGFNETGDIILGYTAQGKERFVDGTGYRGSSFPHRPPPSIESVDVTLYGGQNSSFSGLCRKAKVNWKCYSLDQLEYLAPYFLTPKVTAVVEWGWNNYNPASLIDLTDKVGMRELLLNGSGIMQRIKDSNGNYDAMIGFIFDYEFKLNAMGGYDCFTEFVNANWLLKGQEYKNTSIVKKTKDDNGKSVETPMKDFVEFVNTDLKNVGFKSKKYDLNLGGFNADGRSFFVDPKNTKNTNGAGVTEKKAWLRMDLVQEIFNRYFSLVFKDINGNPVGKGSVLDFSETIICGHPAIKSTNTDVLIPNQFAPRFTALATATENESSKNPNSYLGAAKIDGVEYLKLFEKTGINSTITSKNLTKEFDDLRSVINPKGRSFPMFSKGDTDNTKNSSPGTWGYLSDIYVSTDLIQRVMHNDTAYRMLEELLNTINDAFCGIVQLKIVPHQHSAKFSVIDTNYNPNATPSSVTTLTRFTPGSVNSPGMTNASFTVKISQEMANQMVAQSSAGKMVNGINFRVGMQKANRFVGNDRLYEIGTLSDEIPVSDSSGESKKQVSARTFSQTKFYFYQTKEENSKKYILIEPDKEFMRSVMANDDSGTLIYINSPMMPGTKFEMETLGIGGFTFLGQFTLDHVPKAYNYKNAVWQIADIKQKITNGNWITSITADCRPLSYVKPQ